MTTPPPISKSTIATPKSAPHRSTLANTGLVLKLLLAQDQPSRPAIVVAHSRIPTAPTPTDDILGLSTVPGQSLEALRN